MSFADAIRRLNRLRQTHVLPDYAIFGAVAAAYWSEPTETQDIDIIVRVGSHTEYYALFGKLKPYAERIEGMHLVLAGIPVQMFPTTLLPVYDDALRTAVAVRFQTTRTKVVDREHIIVLGLESWRPKDHVRITQLYPDADRRRLADLIAEFDHADGRYRRRLQALVDIDLGREVQDPT